MSEFTKNVIERIKREGIEPEAGWKFTARRSLLWVGIIIAGGIAALSLSMIALSILAIDRSPFTIAPERLFSVAFFRSLPFLWVGLLIAFSVLAMFEFRNTRHGYRHRIVPVAVVSAVIIIVGAYALSIWGADEQAERMLQKRFPAYAKMIENRETFWSRPEDGFLSGTIYGIEKRNISLVDREGNRWKVSIKQSRIRPSVRLEKGSEVKIIGKMKTKYVFEAEDIRPWNRPDQRARTGEKMKMQRHDENFFLR